MELDAEFVRLPLRFDSRRLAAEITAIPESDWRKHPQGHAGNSALPLVAAGGDPLNDDVRGPMLPTPHLQRCPYVYQVLAALKTVIGRTRLMRIEGNGEATLHTDINYYWVNRTRVHIPVITYPEVDFICGQTTVNMPAGECWIFDTWRQHNVLNRRPEPRIHLVCDTVGTVDFWKLVGRGDRPGAPAFAQHTQAEMLAFAPSRVDSLTYEGVNFPVVMTQGEQQALIEWLFDQIERPIGTAEVSDVRLKVTAFQQPGVRSGLSSVPRQRVLQRTGPH
ncbi:MAG: aspartyl/asparaginyl beta-hydroxylase domain-containing protein [Planctomycetota bacterium]